MIVRSLLLLSIAAAAVHADPVLARSFLEDARAKEASGLIALAAERYQAAHVHGAEASALAGLARCFHVLGRSKLAVMYYSKYLEANPADALARLRLGDLQIEEGDFRGALGSFAFLEAKHPDQARAGKALALGRWGRTLLDAGRTEAARRALQAASRLDPADPRWSRDLEECARGDGP